jgi:hypothetical protein
MDMMMQKMMTTIVDPTVSCTEGKETFLSSPRTSLTNSTVEDHMLIDAASAPELLEAQNLSRHI